MLEAPTILGPRRLACLNVRGAPGGGFPAGVANALGAALPLVPCTHERGDDVAIHWLGPDEWLVTAPAGAEGALEARLRAELTGHVAVVDVSGAWRAFNLSGRAAARVLAKSSPCDVHDRAFAPGRSVQTVFAKTTALIARNACGDFDVLARASYADYVARWLAAASEEFAGA